MNKAFFRWLGAAALGAALALAGCDKVAMDSLKPGVSSEGDVVAALGQPERIWQEADGGRTLEYNRQPFGIVNYMIRIAPSGTMTAMNQVLTQENFARIKPGMGRDEVRYILGKPAQETPYRLSRTVVWVWRFEQIPSLKKGFYVTFDSNWRVQSAAEGPEPDGPELRGGAR